METGNEIPIKLARPAQRALANAGITSLKQLSKFSEKELSELHGIGQNAIAKIKQALIENGMSFAKNE